MGLSFGTKGRSIDLTYGGFLRLRRKIAFMVNNELGDLYERCTTYQNKMSNEELNEELDRLYSDGKLCDSDDEILDFLFESDCGGKIVPKTSRKLYMLINDYDDHEVYGYAAHKDAARFTDFKQILFESYKNRRVISWN